tara:strand:- start:2105 stop:2674 length:570 start_codon:yes stop_codon:yes gene_type:complete
MDYNLIIHKSHTKLYLIKIIQLLSLPIKYNSLTKEALLEEIDTWIFLNIDIEFNDNLLELTNMADFCEFLATPTEKNTDYKTIKDKQLLMLKARKVLCYVNNGQSLERSFYKNRSEITSDALLLAEQGTEIPSCRRAVYKFNSILPPKDQIEIKAKKYTLEEMTFKLKEKRAKEPIFKKRVGNYKLDFS